jgi:hypothetical protein
VQSAHPPAISTINGLKATSRTLREAGREGLRKLSIASTGYSTPNSVARRRKLAANPKGMIHALDGATKCIREIG